VLESSQQSDPFARPRGSEQTYGSELIYPGNPPFFGTPSPSIAIRSNFYR